MEPPIRLNMVPPSNEDSGNSPQQGPQDQVLVRIVDSINEEWSSLIEGSIGRSCSTELGNSQAQEAPIDAGANYLQGDSVAVHIQMHDV